MHLDTPERLRERVTTMTLRKIERLQGRRNSVTGEIRREATPKAEGKRGFVMKRLMILSFVSATFTAIAVGPGIVSVRSGNSAAAVRNFREVRRGLATGHFH